MMENITRRLFFKSLESCQDCGIEIVCPDGTFSFGDPKAELQATIAVHHSRFFRRAVLGGDIGVGESFMDGDWSSPDLVAVVRAAVRNMQRLDGSNRVVSALTRLANWLLHRHNDNTISGSSKNIAYHYDLGNEFYRLFLDPSLVYSCAYYESPFDTLEEAQERKFRVICEKLDLKPGDHLLEIGTGWGGFAVYAATHYGCRITTTTISREQHAYALKRFEVLNAQGHRIELLFEDYRKLTGRYDKIVSIEMFEAVGFRHYDEFFSVCDRLLKKNGAMLLQTITINERHFKAYLRQSDWIKKYIFPGAELASVAEVLRSTARCSRLQLMHLEDIGLDYAETLMEWRSRFLKKREDARALGFDDRFLKMWEFYLAYCEGGFRERYIGDAQALFVNAQSSLRPKPWITRFSGIFKAPENNESSVAAEKDSPQELSA